MGDVRGDTDDDGEVGTSLEGIGGEGEVGHAISSQSGQCVLRPTCILELEDNWQPPQSLR
jgi:hypothetical protein